MEISTLVYMFCKEIPQKIWILFTNSLTLQTKTNNNIWVNEENINE